MARFGKLWVLVEIGGCLKCVLHCIAPRSCLGLGVFVPFVYRYLVPLSRFLRVVCSMVLNPSAPFMKGQSGTENVFSCSLASLHFGFYAHI